MNRPEMPPLHMPLHRLTRSTGILDRGAVVVILEDSAMGLADARVCVALKRDGSWTGRRALMAQDLEPLTLPPEFLFPSAPPSAPSEKPLRPLDVASSLAKGIHDLEAEVADLRAKCTILTEAHKVARHELANARQVLVLQGKRLDTLERRLEPEPLPAPAPVDLSPNRTDWQRGCDLAALRIRKGVRTGDLARELGVTWQVVGCLQRGEWGRIVGRDHAADLIERATAYLDGLPDAPDAPAPLSRVLDPNEVAQRLRKEGQRLREVRLRFSGDRVELARACGLPHAALTDLELGVDPEVEGVTHEEALDRYESALNELEPF